MDLGSRRLRQTRGLGWALVLLTRGSCARSHRELLRLPRPPPRLAMAIADLRLSVRRHGGTGGRPDHIGSGGVRHDGCHRTGEHRSRIPRRLCTKRVGQTLPDWAVTTVVVGASELRARASTLGSPVRRLQDRPDRARRLGDVGEQLGERVAHRQGLAAPFLGRQHVVDEALRCRMRCCCRRRASRCGSGAA